MIRPIALSFKDIRDGKYTQTSESIEIEDPQQPYIDRNEEDVVLE